MGAAAIAHQYSLGHPLTPQLSGININQADLPWWASAILNWLLMVKQIHEGYGDAAKAARYKLDCALSGTTVIGMRHRGPASVYDIYKEFRLMAEAESRK